MRVIPPTITVLPAATTNAVDVDVQIAFFCIPCFPSETTSLLSWWWQSLRSPTSSKDRYWWRWRWNAVRRFKSNNNYKKHYSFRYDPLSYALNFDDGIAEEDGCGYKGFSARFVSVPPPEKAVDGEESCGEHVPPVSKIQIWCSANQRSALRCS